MSTQTVHPIPAPTAATEQVRQAVIDDRAPNVAQLFRDRVAKTPRADAFRFPEGDQWPSVTWTEVQQVGYRLAAGLIALGIEPEDRVAIASSTRYEWALTDLAVMLSGGATTTIYH